MRLYKLTIYFILLFILGCKSTKKESTKIDVENIDLTLNKIQNYIDFENSIKSKDISRDYYVDIDEGIYPFIKKYKFKIAKTYLRKNDDNFEVNVDYYYTKDKDVKLILYEWNTKNNSVSFRQKYDSIANFLNNKIGRYSYKNSPSDTITNDKTYRDDMKWENTKINAYLFRFGDKENRFNQIRLAIYKD